MICAICKNDLYYDEQYCMLIMNKKNGELTVRHNYCFYRQQLLNHEFKEYYKENVKKLTTPVKDN